MTVTSHHNKRLYIGTYAEMSGVSLDATAIGAIYFASDVGITSFWSGSEWIMIGPTPFGEISASDVNQTVAISASGQGNKVQIDVFTTDGAYKNTSPDAANYRIGIDIAGYYMCMCSIAVLSAAGVGFRAGFSLYKNNGATEFENTHAHHQLAGGGGDAGSITLSGIVALDAGDTLELWGWNEDNTTDLVVDDVTLSTFMRMPS